MKAVVLLSGGQDSTTALYWALDKGFEIVKALTFDYGQRHEVELSLATFTAEKNKIPHKVITLNPNLMGESSLTNPSIPNTATVEEARAIAAAQSRNVFAEERGLPSSFTPGRNLIFFSLAATLCAKEGAPNLISGVCQQDDAGYPDCRAGFVALMNATINLGFDWNEFRIITPMIALSKAQTWELADKLGRLPEIIHETSSCYEGDPTANEWGRGCNACGACIERRKGFYEYQLQTGIASTLEDR